MTIQMEDIFHLIKVTLGVRQVGPEDRIVEDLGAESADIANILAAVEDKFGVYIDEEDIADIRTVADLHTRTNASM